MNVFVLVQARLGSSRLRRKVLMPIEDKTMLERVMERAQQIGPPVSLVLPVEDTELHTYAINHGWSYCVGPEEDVLERFRLAAVALKADHVVRVTADCPFLDVEAARWTLAEHLYGGYDLTTFHEAEGRGVQVFKTTALIRASFCPEQWHHSPDVWMLARANTTGKHSFHVHEVRFSVDNLHDLETARRRATKGA